MRIALDASSMLPARTGIGNYTAHLIKELVARAPHHEFKLFMNSYRHPVPPDEFLYLANVRRYHWKLPGPYLLRSWQWLRFPPMELFTGPFDIFHAPASIVAPRVAGKFVITVHDLYFKRHPEHCDTMGGLYLASTLERGLRAADRIIAVSNTTRRDLQRFYQVSSHKIDVIYEGVDERFSVINNDVLIQNFRTEYCLPETFILTVGTLEPRKNFIGLLEAYARLREIYAVPPPLVVVGLRGWKATGIYASIARLKLENSVIFTDYVDDQHLPLIYNAARFFVFPSFFEGFGLPIIEAMACGLPVTCSNAEALQEVAGDAALFFDPHSRESMAQAMRRMLSSRSTREELREKGIERATLYKWRLTARKTIRTYERALSGT